MDFFRSSADVLRKLSSSATIPQAIAGMSPFLIVWLLSDDEDDFDSLLLPFRENLLE